jgi:hypothetical protein
VTTLTEAADAVCERWKTSWGTTTPFFLEGEVVQPPAAGNWARLYVRNMVSQQATLGPPTARKFLRRGRVYVEIKGESNKGRLRLDQLAHQARAVFEGVSFSGLRFFGALAREAGDDGKWLTYLVDAPFDYHETK